MKKPVLAVDFDDVLYDFNSAMCLFHNAGYNTNLAKKDVFSFYFKEVWGCTEEEAIRRVREFCFSPHHLAAIPIEGAQEALAILKDSYEIIIVTSRSHDMEEITRAWLEEHFRGLYDGIYFTSHFDSARRITKSEVCKKIGAEYLIEDAPVHAHDVAATATKVLLFDSPWNQAETPPTASRVYSWKEVLNHLSPSNAV